MYEDDYQNSVNYNERSQNKNLVIKNEDEDDALERDSAEFYENTNELSQSKVHHRDASFELNRSAGKQKSPGGQDKKPNSTGNLENTRNVDGGHSKTFKLNLKQTLPRPQDINDEDKQFLLPKIQTQNEKLKDQVTDLLDMLEAHSLNFYSKKNERYKPQKYEPDESLKLKDKQLYDKLSQIRHYQKEIKELRKQLQDSYNIERLLELENEIKTKESKIKELKEEEQSLKRVESEQQNAMESINREGDYDQKIKEMTDQLRTFKKQYRKIYYEQIDNDKQLIDRHESLVKLDKKVKKMQKQLKEKIGSNNVGLVGLTNVNDMKVTKETLKQLREEINECRQNRVQEEKQIKTKLQEQDEEIEAMEHEMKILEIQVKEKEQEGRLADLKLKELKRTVKHKTLKPLSNSPQVTQKIKDGRYKYQSQNDMASSKILRKKLENGRVTYQDVVLTEENVKLHEQKYQQQSKRYYESQQQQEQPAQQNTFKIQKMNEDQDPKNDTKLKNTQQVPTLGDKPSFIGNNETVQVQNQQPKRLGPSPSQGALLQQNSNNDLQKVSQKIEAQNSDTIGSARNGSGQVGVYSKPNFMGKKKV